MTGIGQNSIRNKRVNRALVLDMLLRKGPLPRRELAGLTRLTPATITKITAELIAEGLVREIGVWNGRATKVGRKFIALDLVPDAVVVGALHIRCDMVETGLVDLKGRLLTRRSAPLPEQLDGAGLVDLAVKELDLAVAGRGGRRMAAIGVAAVGLVDFSDGAVISAPQRPDWRGLRLAGELYKRLSLPTFVENNVRCMALAERMFGSLNAEANSMCVYIGNGIGSGLIIRDQLYQGGLAGGEFGHMTYLPHGLPCWCGNEGCLEQYAAEPALLRVLGAGSVDDVLRLARQGDQDVVDKLRVAGERIGTVLASFINMFYVPRIVVAGALAESDLPLVKEVQDVVNRLSFLARRQGVTVTGSGLGEEIGLLGAASLALWHHVFEADFQLEDVPAR